MTAHVENMSAQPRKPNPAQWTARMALGFSAVVLVLMLVNAVSARSVYPVVVSSLESLQHDLTLRPNDEALRQRVRREDMRIRREYFRHRDFAIRGAWLLAFGIATYLIASEFARRAEESVPVPKPDAAARARAAAEATYRAVIGVGGALAGLLLTLTVLSRHDRIADYVMAAARSSATAGQTHAGAPAAGQAGLQQPVGLPIATSGGTASGQSTAIPQPQGGTLAGPATAMSPLPAVPAPRPGTPTSSAMLSKPLPRVEPSMAPGWDKNWPRFRGPAGIGVAYNVDPPTKWNGQTGQNVLWKTALPLSSWNSPIVWEGRIYCSGADEKRREVYCLDLNSGAILWTTPIPIPAGTTMPKVQADTSYAPSTLATDGARIVAVFVDGMVACLDTSGKLQWSRSFGPLENPYGHATSPIIFGSGVILQLDQGSSGDDGKSSLQALDLVSGKTVWQIKRPVGASWSTPIVINVEGKEQLITTANPWVIAYDPHNGAEIWRADCLGGEVAVSPVMGQGYVLVANQGSNSAAIRPDGQGDVSKQAVAWTSGDGLPDIVSPLAFDDLMLLVVTEGLLTCVEAKTGKKVWEQDISATVRSSPVLAGGKIYLLDASGTMHILQPGRTFKELERCPAGEDANATPAFVGNRIVIRTKQHIVCVGSQ